MAEKQLDVGLLDSSWCKESVPPTGKPFCHGCSCLSKPGSEPGSEFRAQGSGDAASAGDPVYEITLVRTTRVVRQTLNFFFSRSPCAENQKEAKRLHLHSRVHLGSSPQRCRNRSWISGDLCRGSTRSRALPSPCLPDLYLRPAGVSRWAETVWRRYRRHGVDRRLLDPSVPDPGSTGLQSLPRQCPPREACSRPQERRL